MDPTAILSTRTQLDITSFVAAEGVDWGDAAIQAYLADQAVGSSPVDYRIPNRTIRLPLRLITRGATSFATIRTNLQAKVGLMQREGGALMRQIGATPMYADVVNATLHLGGTLLQSIRNIDADAWLELECLPDWYGDEVTLSDHVETTNAQLIFTETGITGNYPGRVRIVVDNDQATDQHGLLWGMRSRYYSNAATAALVYEAESLTVLNGAATGALAGASGGNAVNHATMPAQVWVPIVQTNIASGNQALTHQGTYRAWVRAYSASATPQLRLAWGVGSLSVPTTNATVQLPGSGAFYLLDLGVVQLTPTTGTHQWFGAIQAYVQILNDPISIDLIYLQPLDDGGGQITATSVASPTIASVLKEPGTGANNSGTGTIDWTNPGYVVLPHVGQASVTLTPSQVSHYLWSTGYGFAIPAGATISGIMALVLRWGGGGLAYTDSAVRLLKAGVVAGSNKAASLTWWDPTAWEWFSYGSSTDLWGTTWTPTDINNANFGLAVAATNPTGNTTSGPIGYIWAMQLYVYFTLAGGFSVAADAAIYASSTAQVCWNGAWRATSAGIYGPEGKVLGDLPRIPPSNLEARTCQFFLKESRGNFANEADAGIDDISARVYYRPSYLLTV